jgi:transposase
MARRNYDKEFKLNAINLHKGGKSASSVCKDLGIPDATFYYWLEQYDKEKEHSFQGSGKPKASNEEVAQLKKELEDMTLERDILKKAVAIFSRPKK